MVRKLLGGGGRQTSSRRFRYREGERLRSSRGVFLRSSLKRMARKDAPICNDKENSKLAGRWHGRIES